MPSDRSPKPGHLGWGPHYTEVYFTEAERVRLNACRLGLGTSYAELIHFAAMRAIDELEGLAREAGEMPYPRASPLKHGGA